MSNSNMPEIISDDYSLINWIAILDETLNGAFLMPNGNNPFGTDVVYIALPASDIPNREQFRSVINTLMSRCKMSRNIGLGTCNALPSGANPSATFSRYEATVFLRHEIEAILKRLELQGRIEFKQGNHSFMISQSEFNQYIAQGFPPEVLPMVEEP